MATMPGWVHQLYISIHSSEKAEGQPYKSHHANLRCSFPKPKCKNPEIRILAAVKLVIVFCQWNATLPCYSQTTDTSCHCKYPPSVSHCSWRGWFDLPLWTWGYGVGGGTSPEHVSPSSKYWNKPDNRIDLLLYTWRSHLKYDSHLVLWNQHPSAPYKTSSTTQWETETPVMVFHKDDMVDFWNIIKCHHHQLMSSMSFRCDVVVNTALSRPTELLN